MYGAILKLSYNKIGDKQIQGGICGTFFNITPKLALTAHHVLNTKNFKPNKGYSLFQYWLVTNDNVTEIKLEYLTDFPNKDLTIIKLPNNCFSHFQIKKTARIGEKCFGIGFIASSMPKIQWKWSTKELLIKSVNLDKIEIIKDGNIQQVKKITINSQDIQLDKCNVIKPNFISIIGMSGGPLISHESGKVLGMLSFGLPPDTKEKDETYAIKITEILETI